MQPHSLKADITTGCEAGILFNYSNESIIDWFWSFSGF
jgi:hypothetical protein